MQDAPGAKDDFAEALTLNPDSIHTWLKMANIHLDQSNLEESMKCFESALQSNPKDPDIYYHRGQSTKPCLLTQNLELTFTISIFRYERIRESC